MKLDDTQVLAHVVRVLATNSAVSLAKTKGCVFDGGLSTSIQTCLAVCEECWVGSGAHVFYPCKWHQHRPHRAHLATCWHFWELSSLELLVVVLLVVLVVVLLLLQRRLRRRLLVATRSDVLSVPILRWHTVPAKPHSCSLAHQASL
jgi:hypothetical protein